MLIQISHNTRYRYDNAVNYALQQLRITPKNNPGQKVIDWNIELEGGKKELEFDDHNDNRVVLVSFEPEAQEISVACHGQVETEDKAGMYGPHSGYTPLWYFQRSSALTEPGPAVKSLLNEFKKESSSSLQDFHRLSEMVRDRIEYETGTTNVGTTSEDALKSGHGVCQDHTHVFITAARELGFPARYVGGYLVIHDSTDQEASHAWAEVHFDNLGWVGFDVSNGISPDDRYVRVGSGLDYASAAPIMGMRFGEGSETLSVSVNVQQQ